MPSRRGPLHAAPVIAALIAGQALAAAPGELPLPLTEATRGAIAVNDYDAARDWRREHAGKGDDALRRRFGLPELPRGIGLAIRVDLAGGDGQPSEALLLEAVSDAAADALRSAVDVDSSEFAVAAEGRRLVVAPSRPRAEAVLAAMNGKDRAGVEALRALARHPSMTDAAGTLRTWSHHSPPRYWTTEGDARRAERHGADVSRHVASLTILSADGAATRLARVAADPPLESTMGVLQLKSAEAISCPAWLIESSAGWTILRVALPDSLRRFGALFDDLYAEGISGTFDDVLVDTRDPDGLGVDLERELFDRMGGRCVFGRTPAAGADEPLGFVAMAIRPDAAGAVAGVVQKLMQDDEEAERVTLADGAPPLWRYPGEGDAWSGVAVVGEWLLFAADARAIRVLSDRRQRPGGGSEIETRSGVAGFERFGAAGRETRTRPGGSALDPFFEGDAPFRDAVGDNPGHAGLEAWLKEIGVGRGDAYALSDQSGWLIYSEQPPAAAPPQAEGD